MNTTGRYNQRLPKVDRFSPPPSTIPLPSEPATNANKQTNDSYKRKRAIRQRHRRQQQRQRQDNKDQQQQQQKKRQQRHQQRSHPQQQQQQRLLTLHPQQRQQQERRQKWKAGYIMLQKLTTISRQQHSQVMKELLQLHGLQQKRQQQHQQYERQQALNRYEIVLDELRRKQRLIQPKIPQPAPTQTQQLRWKYGFVLHQMLTTTAHKAHRDMLQSVHNELTTNKPIKDAIHLRPPNNTVTSFHKQPSPTNILRCLLPTSFGFTHCNNCYYFHKLRPPDNITPAKQHLTNPFDTLYFFSKARPPDDDNNVVQQQHFNSFGNSYFFSKVRPPELTLHV